VVVDFVVGARRADFSPAAALPRLRVEAERVLPAAMMLEPIPDDVGKIW